VRQLLIAISFIALSLTLVVPSHAGRLKELLLDAEDMIYAEMSTLGDYYIDIREPQISSNAKGIVVIATVYAIDNITRRSSIYVCEVQFEGSVGEYEPTGVKCY